MKSYIQGLITGAVFVFAFMVLVGFDHDHYGEYAEASHSHDYADEGHDHYYDYAGKTHSHTYADEYHSHHEYSDDGHSHWEYAEEGHIHY